jgi:hypothetical protein
MEGSSEGAGYLGRFVQEGFLTLFGMTVFFLRTPTKPNEGQRAERGGAFEAVDLGSWKR